MLNILFILIQRITDGYLKRNITRWMKQYELSKTGENAVFDKLSNWLLENVPEQKRATIVHGDYR